jgi:hypothetical protein
MPRRKRQPRIASNGQNARCHWCDAVCTNTSDRGPRGATRDHVFPKAFGATDAPRVWACRACNEVKADLTPAQWRRFRTEFPDWKSLYRQPLLDDFRRKFVEIFKGEHERLASGFSPSLPAMTGGE